MATNLEPASAVVEQLRLVPHPEGGWYREIHRSAERITTSRGERSALTTIYYLLEEQQLSRWHVVSSDEIWHFYAGAPLELFLYDPEARAFQRHVLGPPADAKEPVGIVHAGVWQAARSTGAWSLVGCNVGPGFDFADFRFVAALPDHAAHFDGELSRFAGLL
jgi:predicted cupin superfamily sugar epimerase